MGNLVLEGVSKSFAGLTVVDGLDLEVADGEFMVIVGPSGCGKSTTLRMIAGLEEASAGNIYLDGQLLNGVHSSKRNMAMVFQNYALYPHLTVYDNIAFGMQVRHEPKQLIEERTRQAASILQLEDHLDKKPSELSGGQQQRVALGRAMVREPAVFLMDEPLSNLDAKLRSQMRTELKDLQQRLNTTVIYVTHDQVEAMTMGDRIVVLRDGKIQQVGEPVDLYNFPANRFTGEFIGSPPMNFLQGQLEASGEAVRFRSQSLEARLPNSVSSLSGQEVLLGVRAEHLELARDSESPWQAQLRVAAGAVEVLGSETLVYFSQGDQPWTAKLYGQHRIKRGEAVALQADIRHLQLFDPITGERLPDRFQFSDFKPA